MAMRLIGEVNITNNLLVRGPGQISVSDFIFLASAYEVRWPVLSLSISSSHWRRLVKILGKQEVAITDENIFIGVS